MHEDRVDCSTAMTASGLGCVVRLFEVFAHFEEPLLHLLEHTAVAVNRKSGCRRANASSGYACGGRNPFCPTRTPAVLASLETAWGVPFSHAPIPPETFDFWCGPPGCPLAFEATGVSGKCFIIFESVHKNSDASALRGVWGRLDGKIISAIILCPPRGSAFHRGGRFK